jgi:hypothetical protein
MRMTDRLGRFCNGNESVLRPDRRHERVDAHDIHDAREIVGAGSTSIRRRCVRGHRLWQCDRDAGFLARQDLLAVDVAAVGNGIELLYFQRIRSPVSSSAASMVRYRTLRSANPEDKRSTSPASYWTFSVFKSSASQAQPAVPGDAFPSSS